MKKIFLPLILCMLIAVASVAYSQNGQLAAGKKGNIKVIVGGFQSDQGFAKIGLCNSKESFKHSEERAFISATTMICQGKVEYVFEGVPFGTYAVSVYHDENKNGKLDTGLFGKPLELYGFSNKARGIFSRPEYEKAAFVLDRAEVTVRVTVE